MRESADPGGRLPYRLWYEESEIEAIMAERLAAAGVPRVGDGPAVDVESLLELHLGVSPEYTFLPAGVLGATEFKPDGSVRVQVSAELSFRAESEQAGLRLLRSTIAHEAAHVVLHQVLFLRESAALFGGLDRRTELCRAIGAGRTAYSGEWWEWQANRGMSCLLLPADELERWVRDWRARNPKQGVGEMRAAAADAFIVSVEAVRRRLLRPAAAAAV